MELFPKEAIGGAMMTPSELDLAIEKASANIFWAEGNGSARYIIWRFGSEVQANNSLKTEQDTSFNILSDNSLQFGEEYRIVCGLSQFGGDRCTFDARYEEFVIYFQVMVDNQMSVEQFERIVIFIDDQMGYYLLKH